MIATPFVFKTDLAKEKKNTHENIYDTQVQYEIDDDVGDD